MDILFTGNLAPVSTKMFQKIGKESKCVLVCDQELSHIKGRHIQHYQNNKNGFEMERLCATYSFQTAVYFSQMLGKTKGIYSELESLEHSLRTCAQHRIHNFVYVTSKEHYIAANAGDTQESILFDACSKLCSSYQQEYTMNITVLYVPYLYSMENTESVLSDWVDSAVNTSVLSLNGKKETLVDFLCDEDLGECLGRILISQNAAQYTELFLSGRNHCTLEQISEVFKIAQKDLTVVFKKKSERTSVLKEEKTLVSPEGFIPNHIAKEDIIKIVENTRKQKKKAVKKKMPSLLEKIGVSSKIGETITIIFEVLLLFGFATYLDQVTLDNIIINFIDFKLLFVVTMGLLNGLYAGIASSILVCISYVVERMGVTQWQILFYNIQNWLPFAYYLLMGVMSGYIKEKSGNELRFSKEQLSILEDKYVFLNEQYAKAVKNKEQFNHQIISYQDSYGKLYTAVKKLNSSLTDGVCYEAVNVMEELLDNSSVAIYTVNEESEFARLTVCSKAIHNEAARSLQVSKLDKMMDAIKEGKIFVNASCLNDYPEYATPIYNGNMLVGMILLLHADDSQMNMEFSNKFTIITDLIKDSLVRAMDNDRMEENFIEGTNIIKEDKFKEVLAVKEQMRRKEYLEYTLLKLRAEQGSLKEVSSCITNIVRTSDILGMGEDKELYLLLSQSNHSDLELIRRRMDKYDISFEVAV